MQDVGKTGTGVNGSPSPAEQGWGTPILQRAADALQVQPKEGLEASLSLKHTSDTTTHAFKLCAYRLDSTVDAEMFTRTLEVLLATVHKMAFYRGFDAGKIAGIQEEKDARAAGREKLGVQPDTPAATKAPKGLNKLTPEQKIEIRKRIVQAKIDYKNNLPRGFLSDLAREFKTATHNVFHISYGLKLDDPDKDPVS